jgi:hypothetical protein
MAGGGDGALEEEEGEAGVESLGEVRLETAAEAAEDAAPTAADAMDESMDLSFFSSL